jgi:hypothetical protein
MATVDPNIEHLHQLVEQFLIATREAKRTRYHLDHYIQELKRNGYSYPTLARETCFAQGTIQLIIAKELSRPD